MQIAVENLQTAVGTWRSATAELRAHLAAVPRDMRDLIGYYTAPEYYADYKATPTWITEDWQTVSAAIVRPISPGCILRLHNFGAEMLRRFSSPDGPQIQQHSFSAEYSSLIEIQNGCVLYSAKCQSWHRYVVDAPYTVQQEYKHVSLNLPDVTYRSALGKEYFGQFVQTNSYPHFVLGHNDLAIAICPYTGRELGTFQVPSTVNLKRLSSFGGRVYITVGQVVHWCSFV